MELTSSIGTLRTVTDEGLRNAVEAWAGDHAAVFDIPAIAVEWREEINALLPETLVLTPAGLLGKGLEPEEIIEIIDSVDLAEIADRHLVEA